MVEKRPGDLIVITPQDTPDYRNLVAPLAEACWPEFMLHDPISDAHWGALFELFPGYQFGLLDTGKQCAAAMGNSLPLRWDAPLSGLPERGWDWAFEQAVRDHQAGREPNIQCAIQVAIHPAYRGQGVSLRMLNLMRSSGSSHGHSTLIAPVRPSQKAQYPLSGIDRYVEWKNADGLPFDAWLRAHARLGATILKVCHESMTIPGTVSEWESWTGLAFPETGQYIVPGALSPVSMSLETDQGIYVEPNVWMVHALV